MGASERLGYNRRMKTSPDTRRGAPRAVMIAGLALSGCASLTSAPSSPPKPPLTYETGGHSAKLAEGALRAALLPQLSRRPVVDTIDADDPSPAGQDPSGLAGQDSSGLDQQREDDGVGIIADLAWPLNTTAINSLFGMRRDPVNGRQRFHSGIDLSGVYGQLVYAAADGVVTMADWRGGHGRAIVVRHPGGFETHYSHLAEHVVRRGMPVKRGQSIGYLGNSGRSTGPHLHFEVRQAGAPKNPLRYLSKLEGLLVRQR